MPESVRVSGGRFCMLFLLIRIISRPRFACRPFFWLEALALPTIDAAEAGIWANFHDAAFSALAAFAILIHDLPPFALKACWPLRVRI